jgi:hypothetical protein
MIWDILLGREEPLPPSRKRRASDVESAPLPSTPVVASTVTSTVTAEPVISSTPSGTDTPATPVTPAEA